MSNKKYDILKWKTIKVSEEEKHIAYKIGGAYETEKGSIQCDLPEGVQISGNFTISPWKDKEET